MKAYKGFNKDMTCNPNGKVFQFEEGETYEEAEAKLRESGFHACEAPLDVLKYYEPCRSVYHEVELDGVSDERKEDSKVCARKIRIGARISIRDLVEAQIEYVKSRTTTEHTDPKKATAGDSGAATAGDSGAATAGSYGAATAGSYGAATAGDSGAATAGSYGAATAGDSGAATAGDSGAATAGYRGAATAGYRGAATAGSYGAATAGSSGAATAGSYGAATAGSSGAATAGSYGAATAGYRGAATAGYRGAATSRGSTAVGKNGIGLARGNGVKVKGGLGAILLIAEENEINYDVKEWRAFIVDGDAIKEDTWYMLKDGELVEVNE